MSPRSTLLKSLLLLGCIAFSFSISYPSNLTFRADGTYTILQLTDLHYGESDQKDLNNTLFQDVFIGNIKPDLVACTGDLSSGYAYTNQTNFTQNNWEKFWLSIEKYEVPYSYAMGNHDPQGDLTPDQIYELEVRSKYSILAGHNAGSYENFTYWFPIYSALKPGKVAVVMWIFNSHSNGCENVTDSWGCVGPKQIEWFNNQSQLVKSLYGDDVYHLAIVHIPLPHWIVVYNYLDFFGTKGEDVCCPSVSTGLFEALRFFGIKAIYCGHDHDNDFAGYVDGVELVYGRKSGWGGYGGLAPTLRGARIITLNETLNENGTLTIQRGTYIQIENEAQNGLVTDNFTNQEVPSNRSSVPQWLCSPPSAMLVDMYEDVAVADDKVEKALLAAAFVVALAIVGLLFWVAFRKRTSKELQKPLYENVEGSTANFVSCHSE